MCCETELAAASHHFHLPTGETKLAASELETWKPKWKLFADRAVSGNEVLVVCGLHVDYVGLLRIGRFHKMQIHAMSTLR